MDILLRTLQILSERKTISFVLLPLIVILYIIPFFLLYPVFGYFTAVGVVIPVTIIGALWGKRAGLGASLFFFLLHSLIFAGYEGNIPLPKVLLYEENWGGAIISALAGFIAGSYRDFSLRLRRALEERSEAQEALRLSEERYALAAEGANDGLWDWNVEEGSMFYSPRWIHMIGCEEGEVRLTPEEWFSRTHPDDKRKVEEELRQVISGRQRLFSVEHRILHKKQYYLWVLMRAAAVRNEEDKVVRLTGSMTDITEKTVKDPLTGLPNRILLLEHLDHELIQHVDSDEKTAFAVITLDVDNFSLINNSMGPLWGDMLLSRLAKRLEGCIRLGDSLGRVGGDEFVIILHHLRSRDDLDLISERIRNEMMRPFRIQDKEIIISVSMGIAMNTIHHKQGTDLLRDANIALEQAKKQGKGFSTLFDMNMHSNMVSRMTLENDLHHAIDRNEFILYYQPIVDSHTREVTEMEALIRWNHRSLGIIPPDRFIPILEDSGMIQEAGEWVLRSACMQLADWKKKGVQIPAVSVNISAHQIKAGRLPALVRDTLARSGIAPADLMLEITETALMEDTAAVRKTFSTLQEMGIRLAVDDFGTGYSTMSSLRNLPIHTLKIDKSFVDGCTANPKDRLIISTIIELAKGLGLKTLAEGVEREDQLTLLKSSGCRKIQGYYFSPPMQARAAQEWVRKQSEQRNPILEA